MIHIYDYDAIHLLASELKVFFLLRSVMTLTPIFVFSFFFCFRNSVATFGNLFSFIKNALTARSSLHHFRTYIIGVDNINVMNFTLAVHCLFIVKVYESICVHSVIQFYRDVAITIRRIFNFDRKQDVNQSRFLFYTFVYDDEFQFSIQQNVSYNIFRESISYTLSATNIFVKKKTKLKNNF